MIIIHYPVSAALGQSNSDGFGFLLPAAGLWVRTPVHSLPIGFLEWEALNPPTCSLLTSEFCMIKNTLNKSSLLLFKLFLASHHATDLAIVSASIDIVIWPKPPLILWHSSWTSPVATILTSGLRKVCLPSCMWGVKGCSPRKIPNKCPTHAPPPMLFKLVKLTSAIALFYLSTGF